MSLAKTFIGYVDSGGGGSTACVLSAYNQPAGELIVVFSGVYKYGGGTDSAPTDTALNTYLPMLAGSGYGPSSVWYNVWYCANCNGSVANVILQQPQYPAYNNYASFAAWHVSGADVSSPADASATSNVPPTGGVATSAAFTTTFADEVLFCICGTGGAGSDTRTAPAGWTDDTSGLSVAMSCASEIVSAIQTNATAAWGVNVSNNNPIVVATFKALGSSPPVPSNALASIQSFWMG